VAGTISDEGWQVPLCLYSVAGDTCSEHVTLVRRLDFILMNSLAVFHTSTLFDSYESRGHCPFAFLMNEFNKTDTSACSTNNDSMDSPGVKTTYTATVKAPEWCTVLMSALSDDFSGEKKGTFKWRQPVPTSAYLIALAAGDLSFRDIR
jgi:hypothetical protein